MEALAAQGIIANWAPGSMPGQGFLLLLGNKLHSQSLPAVKPGTIIVYYVIMVGTAEKQP